MASDDSSPPNAKRLRRSPPSSTSPDHLLVDEILTRLPIATAVRLRAVSRDWNAALTSDYFILAHRARAAAARHPELLFFAPPGARNTTTFYACSLRHAEPPPAARELLTIDYFSAKHAVMSPTPCRGLTLVSDGRAPQYYLLNLSTGDHVALPPCQPAAELDDSEPLARLLPGGDTNYLPSMTPWEPFELSTTGLGFDTATGEHKVVRLFKKRNGEHVCEVYTLGKPGGWRPCAGRVPASAASFVPALPPVFVNGYLYWLLQPAAAGEWQIRRILSFSVGAEQFGSVYVPPRLSYRMCHLANLDGSLCAVYDNRIAGDVYGLFTCSEPSSSPSPSWSVRCSIYLKRLPRQVSDELMEERVIVPLCTAGGKILLATGHHKVFAYDAGRNTVERVFRMQEFVNVPDDCLEAPLLLSVGLHDECIADVHAGAGGKRMLHVYTGSRDNDTVVVSTSFSRISPGWLPATAAKGA